MNKLLFLDENDELIVEIEIEDEPLFKFMIDAAKENQTFQEYILKIISNKSSNMLQ